ncbi:DUF4328 domain-containing protein [Actinoplanes sp. N902-109]|uniref:DUF4328 domain-containing protein n=1 Tax=Actinoplanes sp. (strain N902-109) TaxID=649831 RepID=UPI000329419D|nr:DUF4328 domain-containing protein [Actinoplanes sp. N902-109]AGL20895.1 hypothetical protein L083_7385 [Actinoplanes sp. N902-109]
MTDYAPYTYPQPSRSFAPHGTAVSLKGRAILAGSGLGFALLLSIAVLALSLWALIAQDIDEDSVSDILAAADDIGMLVTYLLAGIPFIVWLRRAAQNLQAFGADLTWGPGWAIGAWFIPLANVVLPLLMLSEIDRTSAGFVRDVARVRLNRAVYVLWAVLWTMYLVIGRNGAAVGETDDDVTVIAALSGAGAVLEIAAAVSAVLLILRITANQETVLQRGGDPYAAFPPPAAFLPPVFPATSSAGFPRPAAPSPAFPPPASPAFPPPVWSPPSDPWAAPASPPPPPATPTAMPPMTPPADQR